MNIPISFNPKIIGKPPKPSTIEEQKQLGRKIGYNWESGVFTPEDIFYFITEVGLASSCKLSSDYRHGDNFLSRQLLMVDVDNANPDDPTGKTKCKNPLTIEQLSQDDFYNAFSCGYYATPSYADSWPKFRILFLVENPIDDIVTYSAIMKFLIDYFSTSYPDTIDTKCDDPSRVFFGTKNCNIKKLRPEVIISNIHLQTIVEDYIEGIKTTYPHSTTADINVEYTEEISIKLNEGLRILSQHEPRLPYDNWIRLIWSIYHATNYNKTETTRLLKSHYPEERPREYEKILQTKPKKITVGSFVHMVKQHNPGYNLWKSHDITKYSISSLHQARDELQVKKKHFEDAYRLTNLKGTI